jgi:preprotein translocase subunit SecG
MQVLNIFHVLVAIALIAFVLIQRGQGATAGAAFGSGASGTVFGSRGAGNFLSRSTWVLATLFCAISLTMAVLVSRMMETPETDLGVVTQPPAAVQVEDESSATDLTVGPAESTAPDMPSLEQAVEDAVQDAASEQGADGVIADDLPAVEDEADSLVPAADDS